MINSRRTSVISDCAQSSLKRILCEEWAGIDKDPIEPSPFFFQVERKTIFPFVAKAGKTDQLLLQDTSIKS